MPVETPERYERVAVAGNLLRLSDGRAAADPWQLTEPSPCTYLIVRTRELPPGLRAYVEQLPLEPIARDDERQLFRVGDPARAR